MWGRKVFREAKCASDPSLDPYIKKPVFEHDPRDEDTARDGYTDRKLVCEEIQYTLTSDWAIYVIQMMERYKIEDCDYGQTVENLITVYRVGSKNF